jgi:hypothetical protein
MTRSIVRGAAPTVLATTTLLGLSLFANPARSQTPPPAATPAPAASAAPALAAEATPAPAAEPVPETTSQAPTAPSAPTTAPPGAKPPPEPSTGFQMAFRTGLSFPVGDVSGAPGDSLGARYAWQVPLVFDIGAKIGPSVFLGAYLGFGFGAEGSDPVVEGLCDDDDDNLENDVSCSAVTVRFGFEAQYHFMPGEKMNAWVGYGAGWEAATQTLSDRTQGYSESTTAHGFTYASLSGGLDFRTRVVGAGPYAEVAAGRFTRQTTEVSNVEAGEGDISDPAWHAWISLGLRMVLFP